MASRDHAPTTFIALEMEPWLRAYHAWGDPLDQAGMELFGKPVQRGFRAGYAHAGSLEAMLADIVETTPYSALTRLREAIETRLEVNPEAGMVGVNIHDLMDALNLLRRAREVLGPFAKVHRMLGDGGFCEGSNGAVIVEPEEFSAAAALLADLGADSNAKPADGERSRDAK